MPKRETFESGILAILEKNRGREGLRVKVVMKNQLFSEAKTVTTAWAYIHRSPTHYHPANHYVMYKHVHILFDALGMKRGRDARNNLPLNQTIVSPHRIKQDLEYH